MSLADELYIKWKVKEREREAQERARLREAEAAEMRRRRRRLGILIRPPRWAARRPERRAA